MANNTVLTHLLKQLCLHEMRSNWEDLAQQAEEYHWTYAQFLTTLCECEIIPFQVNEAPIAKKNILW